MLTSGWKAFDALNKPAVNLPLSMVRDLPQLCMLSQRRVQKCRTRRQHQQQEYQNYLRVLTRLKKTLKGEIKDDAAENKGTQEGTAANEGAVGNDDRAPERDKN